MNAPASFTDRRRFIGGSDAASLYGVSPWKTPLQLWEEKTAPESDAEYLSLARAKFFKRRKRQEPVVAEMLADEYGIEVTRLSLDGNPNRYIDPDVPYFAAEVDFEFHMSAAVRNAFPARDDFLAIPDGTLLNGEIKTVSPFAAGDWGEEGTENVPLHYAAQLMWGLGVTRRPGAVCAALFGLDSLIAFPVMADGETISAMRHQAAHFWNENVLTRTPPAPLTMPDMLKLYGKKLGRPVELDLDTYTAFLEVSAMRARAKEAEESQRAAEWKVAEAIAREWGTELPDRSMKDERPDLKLEDNALLLFDGKTVGTWKAQRGSYLDQKRLGEERPEIVERYKRETYYRVFRTKKG